MINRIKFTNIIVFILLILSTILFSENDIIVYGWIFYLIQFVCITISLFNHKNNSILFFSPSYITIAYLSLNFILGHYVVSNDIGFDSKYYNAFANYSSYKFITFYFLTCNMLVFLSINFKKFNNNTSKDHKKRNIPNYLIYTLFILLLCLSFIEIDLSMFGGSGDFSYVFKLTTAIFLVMLLSNIKSVKKYILYAFTLVLFVVGHFDSKREFMYVLILILFLEIVVNNVKFKPSFKLVFISLIGITVVIWSVVTSSILRGYGNYNTDNPIEAAMYVPDYLTSDFAQNALVNNFELSTAFGNGSNAVNYVYNDEVDLLYGSTFIKFLFLPIPRSVFPDKPDSMIDIYTKKFDPVFRNRGGSYPVIIYAEAFWNFHLLGMFLVYILFFVLNNFYIKMVNNIKKHTYTLFTFFTLYLYVTIIQFVRGSGLELWLLYALLSLPLSYILLNLFLKKNAKNENINYNW